MRAPDTIDHELLKKLGRELRSCADANGMTQSAFAEFDRNYWGRVERGKQNISISTLSRIVRSLGKSISDLVEGI